jgi:uncharacterized SAM-dependent methyltransferase
MTQGIPFWREKLRIVRALIGVVTNTELVKELYSPAEGVEALRVNYNISKWHKSQPTTKGEKGFFKRLVKALDCPEDVTGVRFWQAASLDVFISYLPEAKQAIAREIVTATQNQAEGRPTGHYGALDPPPSRPGGRRSWGFAHVIHRGPVEHLNRGVERGHINHVHFYLSPEAAYAWEELVQAEAYPTYDQCKEGLRALLTTPAFEVAIDAIRPTRVVMLAGAGAPTKDLLLIRHILARPFTLEQSLKYYLLDVSWFMLANSMWFLDKHLQSVPGHTRVDVEAVWGDVMVMDGLLDRGIAGPGGPVLFGITGGTIGNFSEREFFSSLNRVSKAGDLLLLSADTLDGLDQRQMTRALTQKYDHIEARNFVAPVVRSVLGVFDHAESIKHALKRIEVDLRRGTDGRLSDVPGTYAVTLSLDVAGNNIRLTSSTRYPAQSLVDFAARYGWDVAMKVPSPLNAHFVQFVFQKKVAES